MGRGTALSTVEATGSPRASVGVAPDGRNFEALDSLEWLARMSDHIPDPGQHRTVFYGLYANRARGAGRRDAGQMPEASTEPPRRRSSPTRARLIAKIYQVDPLVCTRCGRKMQMIAFLTDQLSIRKPYFRIAINARWPSARCMSSVSPSTAQVTADSSAARNSRSCFMTSSAQALRVVATGPIFTPFPSTT